MNENVRAPAAVGTFYPAARAALDELVSRLLAARVALENGHFRRPSSRRM